MSTFILHIIDYFFIVFHTVLILFNVLGWIVPRWRFANLITLSLTAFSWFILGIWYGFGYCPFTDWHWKIRQLLGYTDDSNSYIHFLILKITGINFSESFVDVSTVIVFFTAFFISVYFAVRKKMLNRKLKNE
ncbi:MULTISPECIES: DUF2784 domain-containing protein [Flavobacterium]|uniref:DUF2784 domain-containing protein n=1 Tax=Flavobacterium gawalongense TaxID=2594432 RepID=A0A553BRD5_9FLAO|nr:DUF2784 domain-containing protein [Flavobacterium gawalongense]TRX03458.1 DUF2784 domain-containing protein [Flavobacterium gawalongense]TRX06773.1 DUF2784 domain-containing protein [Flavobacterium gawalongense]TRX10806.1 DUF2784 domain-containing protein [Flavobacterium gawalongense]TRX11528.1 DUF2784 domain-containing protein [Flavobacterium gawalongense]TRX29298.1 DUF2784 domain-containing protein [Flavobacterium gawalongense]